MRCRNIQENSFQSLKRQAKNINISESLTNMENHDQTNREEQTSDLAYKKLMDQINKTLLEKYPNAFKLNEVGEMKMLELQQLEGIMQDQSNYQAANRSQGRGGNNVAENMKKSVLSILKKRLSPALYQQYEQKYIKTYELKSQKENFVLYFLFLHQFLFQRKISPQSFQLIKSEIISRIQKYIRNSEIRREAQPQRKEFHEKNLNEFRKFLQIDLDFSRPRSYQQVREWIRWQYLKKKAVFQEAERKARKIIEKHPLVRKIFTDLQVEVKVQAISSNQQISSENSWSMKMEKKQGD